MRAYLAVQGYWLVVLLAVACSGVFAVAALQHLWRVVFRRRDSRVLAARIVRPHVGATELTGCPHPSTAGPRAHRRVEVLALLSTASTLVNPNSVLQVVLTAAWRLMVRPLVGSRNSSAAEGWLRTAGLDGLLQPREVERVATLAALASAAASTVLVIAMGAEFTLVAGCALGGLYTGSRQVYGALRRASERRQQVLLSQVVPWLDMLALSSAAGLSFDRSVEEYAARFRGELPLLLQAAHVSWTTGVTSRESALERVALAVGSDAFSRVISALIQALALGSPLSIAAESYANDMRAHRASQIEERIGKAPVKMLMPLGGLILPAMLILLFTPILSQVFSGLRGGW